MDFDLYCLRIFRQVVKDKSFSAAARSLGIAQPTVSQKIAGLEADIGKKLFERVGHDIHLTKTGKELLELAEELLDRSERFSDHVQTGETSPSGLVRYAMPESCQWTPHYRRIMGQIKEYPRIQFEIDILPSEKIIEGILKGHFDFGFIVGERLNPELRFGKFSDERYSAVSSDQIFFRPFADKELSKLRMISYPGWEPFFEVWAKSQGLWEKLKNQIQTPSIKIGTLAGAIHATQEGAGVAVIPTHCVAGELSERSLFEFSAKKAFSPVHIARRIGEKLPHRAELVLKLLRQAKQELQ